MGQQLYLHCGGRPASYNEVCAIDAPEAVGKWAPLASRDPLEFIHEQLELERWEIESERYGLNRNGNQLFAVFTAKREDWAEDANSVALGFRGSIDKSMAEAVVSGAHIFVCDNMAFHGSSFRKARKNTINVWSDVKDMISDAIDHLDETFQVTETLMSSLRGIECSKDNGYRALGLCRGRGWLTSTQMSRALSEWQESRFDHEDFQGEHALALYNAITDGLKKGSVNSVVKNQIKVGKFFERAVRVGELTA